MKMSCGFKVIAEETAGTPYGHVPGHGYHDVRVGIGSKADTYRAVIIEVWGSAQESDEEHGRQNVVARHASWRRALGRARIQAERADMDASYLTQAMSSVVDQMEFLIPEPEEVSS